jgi:hypothetical protein
MLTVLAQRQEKRADRLSRTTRPYPEHLSTFGIHDHGSVTVPFMQGEFVHDEIAYPTQVGLRCLAGQPRLIERLECVPVKARQVAYVLYRQQSQEPLNNAAETLGNPRIRGEPGQLLTACAAAVTPQTPYRYIQPDSVLEQIRVPDTSLLYIMHTVT